MAVDLEGLGPYLEKHNGGWAIVSEIRRGRFTNPFLNRNAIKKIIRSGEYEARTTTHNYWAQLPGQRSITVVRIEMRKVR